MLDVVALIVEVNLTLENSAVFQAQIGEQLIAMAQMGLRAGLVCISADSSRFERAIGDRLRRAGVQVRLVPESGGFVTNVVRLTRALRQLRRSTAIHRAYVRGLWGPIVLRFAHPTNAIPHVYDLRGLLADEMRAIRTPALKRMLYTALESWGVRRAVEVTAVSRPLAKEAYGRARRSTIHVIPSCVDTTFFEASPAALDAARQQLGLSASDCVLVYSGGLSHYQQIPAMIELWRRVRDEPGVRFLLLTNDNPHSKALEIGDLSVFGSRLHHESVPREHIPVLLGVSTIGFMLRDTRDLNRTASPVKFAEYVAAGLAVVASPGTGDVSDRITSERIGTLIDPAKLEDGERALRALIGAVRSEGTAMRERALALARSTYDWRAYKTVYRALYAADQDARSAG